jgi:hypothetical protein
MLEIPWYFNYTHLGTPYVITLSIAGALIGISCCAQIYYIRHDSSSAHKVKLAFQGLSVATLFLYEYICLCYQFDYLLKNTDSFAACYDNGPDSDIMWYRNRGCNIGTLCNFWNLDSDALKWDASLMGQTIDKISVGLGLIIYPLLRLFATFMYIYLSDRGPFADSSDMTGAKRVALGLVQTAVFGIVEYIIMQQQSCVLMPLQYGILAPDQSTFRLDVPVSQRQALCLYKTAAAGIPVGIPMFIGGLLILSCCIKRLENEDSDKKALAGCAMLCFCGGPVMLVVVGLALMVFWLFGGFVIGAWCAPPIRPDRHAASTPRAPRRAATAPPRSSAPSPPQVLGLGSSTPDSLQFISIIPMYITYLYLYS